MQGMTKTVRRPLCTLRGDFMIYFLVTFVFMAFVIAIMAIGVILADALSKDHVAV